ncbi:hypothetical protein KPL37_16045 [Clostridium frigoris]|uniref:Uncharacterized protein n=1 Tax=Clostridium frigoris TaxID=205327 RepID=A0ABS6BXA0_9CLOT|nr:hypothetical protein [Clostridium frigoris]MBU3161231.1 hypothetical protein [Clostridium frigoris]
MYYIIRTLNGYLTRKERTLEFSFNTDINFAYALDNVSEVQEIIKGTNIIGEIVMMKYSEKSNTTKG